MEKNIIQFLKRSFVSLVLVSLLVFIGLTMVMANQTRKSIRAVGNIYMAEMNVQLQQKFSSIISLRLTEVDGIIRRTQYIANDEQRMERLKINADAIDFLSLGFYTKEDGLDVFYGEPFEILHDQIFEKALESGNDIVTQGVGVNGDKVLVLGKQTEYPMENGGTCDAMVATLSMDYLSEALFLDSGHSLVYTHIIDTNGDFVIRSGDAFRKSYFERLMEEVEPYHGKQAQNYVDEFREAMEAGEEYFATVQIAGELQQIYCSPVSDNSDWYLVTVMSEGALEGPITRLDGMRMVIMATFACMIFIVMTIIFILYFRMSRRQMKNLAEARNQAVEANKAKSEFLSSMSHDIRTPMNAIVGMTEIALKNIKDMDRVEECLRKVKLSSKHLLGLINDVLDMSKIESGKMTLNLAPVSLRDVMDDIVNIIKPQVKERNQFFDIFIKTVLAEDVYCDSVRLNQVLLNLLSNAVKFTPEQGRIDVHMFQEESQKGEEYVCTHFIVEDTGIGMSEEFQKKIWDTFSRENTEQVQHITGTGLGMSITKCIVSLMGGRVTLASQQNKGSRFEVIVDLKKADIKETDMKLPPWNILVVDDNELLCASATANLEELGCHGEWVMDGRKAIEMIKERRKAGEDYQFVLIDWKMPNMSGIETINEIRSSVGKDIPIFLVSAYDWSDVEGEISTAMIEGFISKPLFKSTLYSRLVQYVDGYREDIKHQSPMEMDFTGKRILLAEDIDLNWEVAQSILSMGGLELERAENGQICVEMFERSELWYYDAVLMDIRMPVMNGYDATIAIRKLEREDSKLPIIAMSADAFSDDVQRCLDSGMNAHIAKPIDLSECMRVLSEYL